MSLLRRIEQGQGFSAKEPLSVRISDYLPSKEFLKKYPFPDKLSLERKKIFNEKNPGADFGLVYSHSEEKLVIVPVWHPLYTTSVINHAGQYGSGVFEGGSLEPVYDGNEITGANVILHGPRTARLGKSLGSRLFELPGRVEDFSQGILDLAAILGERVLIDKEGKPSRAYIRPSATPGQGKLGVGLGTDHQIDSAVLIYNWPTYFLDSERVYYGEGLKVGALPEQRLTMIKGKDASNYGEAGAVGTVIRNLGLDEALYFGPYLIDPKNGEKIYINAQAGTSAVEQLLKYGVIADGPGEEVFALTEDRTLIYPPLDVNRLGGTTLRYIVDHMAPALGIKTEERPFSLEDIRENKIVSLCFAGNAARVAPIGEITIFDGKHQKKENLKLQITDQVRQLVEEFEAEVTGKTKPSDPSLLTSIDLVDGNKARKVLENAFTAWL